MPVIVLEKKIKLQNNQKQSSCLFERLTKLESHKVLQDKNKIKLHTMTPQIKENLEIQFVFATKKIG